jgi:ribosomal protein S18 acetylase RimI-like enzyme
VRASFRKKRLRAAEEVSDGVPRDLVVELPAPFRRYARGGLECDISFACPASEATWPAGLAEEVLTLTRANMKEAYEAAEGWGWSESKKRAEACDPATRYILAHAVTSGALLGFASLRFVAEGHHDSAYVYELQLAPAAQRKGLGRFLMLLVEMAARNAGMQKCVTS